MINQISWKVNDDKFTFFKITNAPYHEIEEISQKFNIDIDTLMESYDLEQYPYIQSLDNEILNTIIDLPIINDHINVFSVPIHILLLNNTIILISRLTSEEFDAIDNVVTLEDSIVNSLFAILNYVSSMYLIKLRNLKKQLDKVMQEVYVKNMYNPSSQSQSLKMAIEIDHYMSSLETNNMVIKQIETLLQSSLTTQFYNMKLDSIQAYDIAKLYSKLNRNLIDYFKLQQEKIVNKKLNRLTTLTVSLTLPNIVFGFYGMNVNLPFANLWYIAAIIVFFTVIISIIIYKFLKVDK